MRYSKASPFLVLLVGFIAVSSLSLCALHVHFCMQLKEQLRPDVDQILDFNQLQTEALAYLNETNHTAYSKYGYYTLFLDKNDQLKQIAVTFHFHGYTNPFYDVYFDENGVLKGNSTFYGSGTNPEMYQNEPGIFVVKGIYGSYLLFDNGTFAYIGGMNPDDLDSSDIIDASVFHSADFLQKYGIDISRISNAIITQKNSENRSSSLPSASK